MPEKSHYTSGNRAVPAERHEQRSAEIREKMNLRICFREYTRVSTRGCGLAAAPGVGVLK